jgi:hypothetical protein
MNIYAQNSTVDIIYLKNGSIIKGDVIEFIPNEKVKIQTKDGSIFVYTSSEVEKIIKEPNVIKTNILDSSSIKKNSLSYFKKGFLAITEIGALFADKNGNNNKPDFSFNQIIGSRTNEHFSIGMGAGIDANKNILYVPITLDTRIYFIKKRITPFLNIAPGYALLRYTFKNYYVNYTNRGNVVNYTHTFIANLGLGAEFKINKQIGVLINIGGRLIYIPKTSGYRSYENKIGGGGFFKIGISY